jgi:hypothetical protein
VKEMNPNELKKSIEKRMNDLKKELMELKRMKKSIKTGCDCYETVKITK